MTDNFRELAKNLNDRLSNPMVFSFLFSWLVVNFKIVLVVFSEMRIDDKLSFVESGLTLQNSFVFTNDRLKVVLSLIEFRFCRFILV